MGQLSALIVVEGMSPLHLLLMTASILFCCNFTFANPRFRDHVDLGDARHLVTTTNITGRGYEIGIYKKIRFAQPPIEDLRFNYAQEPAT